MEVFRHHYNRHVALLRHRLRMARCSASHRVMASAGRAHPTSFTVDLVQDRGKILLKMPYTAGKSPVLNVDFF